MKQVKIVVFVPHSHFEAVMKAMGDAGAGEMGNYSHCSYFVDGFGSFLPLDGAHPFIGEVGKFEKVPEIRLEYICSYDKAKAVILAMRKAHPYEEIAFDIYPLLSEDDL